MMRNKAVGLSLLAATAVVVAIAVRHASAAASPVSNLKRGHRYRFFATVKPAFPDEASGDAQAFFAQLIASSVFGAAGADTELEAVDNFPGETRVRLVANAVQEQSVQVPVAVFGLGGRELVVTRIEEVRK
jgi:hypothetical protein